MPRISYDEWVMQIAQVVAQRSTCIRRAVGCILTNKRGHILATGYNGRHAGAPHCNEGHPCRGANAPSGTDLDLCEAIHAEQNALLQCHDVYAIHAAYTTTFPCATCLKLLLNTSCTTIYYHELYSQSISSMDYRCALWRDQGRYIYRI